MVQPSFANPFVPPGPRSLPLFLPPFPPLHLPLAVTNIFYSQSHVQGDRRAAAPGSFTLTLNDSSTNAYLESQLCSFISNQTSPPALSIRLSSPSFTVVKTVFVLPSCVFSATSLTSLTVEVPLIIYNNGSYSDPLQALPSSLTALTIYESIIFSNTTQISNPVATFIPNWTSFFASHTALESVSITSSNIGGSPPSRLGSKISYFLIDTSRLTGSIPSSIWSGLNSSSMTIAFPRNQLSGTVARSLFTSVPSGMTSITFDISSNGFTGALPSGLFSDNTNIKSIDFRASDNQLTGSVTSALFPTSFPSLANLNLYLTRNRMTYLADDFAAPLNNLTFLVLEMSDNQLSGSLPLILHKMKLPQLSSAIITLNRNRYSGTLPRNLWPVDGTASPNLKNLYYRASGNALTGTIPATLFLRDLTANLYTQVDISNNSISGTLPANIFETVISISYLYASHNLISGPLVPPVLSNRSNNIVLDLSSNPIGGTIPEDYIPTFTQSASQLVLYLANSGLTGSLPRSNFGCRNSSQGVIINLDNNDLSGEYPFDQLSANLTSICPSSYSVFLSIAGNQLSGPIQLSSSESYRPRLTLRAAYNNFSSLSVDLPNNYLLELDVSGNKRLTGTLPEVFFNSSGALNILAANYTALTGDFPIVTGRPTYALTYLDLNHTSINFCSSGRPTWSPERLSTCQLLDTNAQTCASAYPKLCFEVAVIDSGSPSYPVSPEIDEPHSRGYRNDRISWGSTFAAVIMAAITSIILHKL